MRIEPSDYLDLDSAELLGPSAVRLKGEEAPAPSPVPNTLDEVASALRQAQLQGDQGQIGLLSVQLDQLLNQTAPTTTQKAPQQPEEEKVTDSSGENDGASEEPTELLQSDFNRSLVAELGDTKTDEIYTAINNCGDEEIIASFMDSIDGDGVYANEVVEWAKLASDAGATPTGDATFGAYDDAAIANIQNNSAYADEFINLNRLVSSGQLTQAQLYQQVMQDPGLMAEAVKLRNANIISF